MCCSMYSCSARFHTGRVAFHGAVRAFSYTATASSAVQCNPHVPLPNQCHTSVTSRFHPSKTIQRLGVFSRVVQGETNPEEASHQKGAATIRLNTLGDLLRGGLPSADVVSRYSGEA